MNEASENLTTADRLRFFSLISGHRRAFLQREVTAKDVAAFLLFLPVIGDASDGDTNLFLMDLAAELWALKDGRIPKRLRRQIVGPDGILEQFEAFLVAMNAAEAA